MTIHGQTILLIDDDATLLDLLGGHLEGSGYSVVKAEDGSTGLKIAADASPDLIVLDIMMPGLAGWDVCERLRGRSKIPIILLTAKGEEIDKLRGFRLGVDDFVSKPFSFAELTARIGAVLARGATRPVTQALTLGDLRIDFDDRRVTVGGRTVDLTPTEYRLLEALARHPHRTMPAEALLEQVWGAPYAGEFEHVKHYIWTLRKKIEVDPGDPQHILTERGFGYRFE
ncbi:MAG TPA: response regulator transcription factor [Anaerolineales bacterium]